MNRVLCIIPARGGSKRIPRKNIKNFLGKPIVSYSIESAIGSGIFDEVMISTDDKEIADIAIKSGAKLPFFRSSDNSNDYATTVDVLLEVLEEYEKLGKEFDYVCCLYPTAPFVASEALIKAFKTLITENFDSVFPVIEYSFPIQRAMRVKEGKWIEMLSPDYMATRSQDLEPTYHDAGQFYFFKKELLKKESRLWTDNTGFIIVDEMRAQDIDNKTDWELAELKYKLLYG